MVQLTDQLSGWSNYSLAVQRVLFEVFILTDSVHTSDKVRIFAFHTFCVENLKSAVSGRRNYIRRLVQLTDQLRLVQLTEPTAVGPTNAWGVNARLMSALRMLLVT